MDISKPGINIGNKHRSSPGATHCTAVMRTRADTYSWLCQSFGALLAFDNNYIVTRASQNIDKFVGVAAEKIIGESLETLVELKDFTRFKRLTVDRTQPLIRLRFTNSQEIYALIRYLSDEETYVDLIEEREDKVDAMLALQEFVAATTKANTQLQCAQAIADQVRKVSKFDRVKIYKFDQQWNGEVIAESRVAEVASYKGLHFPEADIPVQARELYIRNRVRVISDVNDPQTPIVQKQGLKPLDMSFSFVRSVSPIHLQYLRNMDVAASMSISLFEKGKLWGLIACHNQSAKTFDWEEETLYRTISDIASSRLSSLKTSELSEERSHSLNYLHKIVSSNKRFEPETLVTHPDVQMNNLITCTGIAVSIGRETYAKNATPDKNTLQTLVEWLNRGADTTFYCEDLPTRFGEGIGGYACGLLAVKLQEPLEGWLMWFRMEQIEEVSWAGDPYAAKTTSEYGERLYPRTSFKIWKETTKGRSKQWTATEIKSAEELAGLLSNPALLSLSS